MLHSSLIVGVLMLMLVCGCAQQSAAPAGDLEWPAVTQTNKPWTRWWWMGSAVDEKNLKREIEQMHAAGIGGVEVTPLYGVTGYENRDIQFLSPKWIQMLRYTAEEGKKLDFGVDMATGTGWPFGGGPVVTPELADAKVALVNGKIVSQPTEMKVKRAAPGDEGWVLNPYSVTALTKYLDWFKPLSGIPRGLIRMQFHDSFEYSGNWSTELPARFKAMHGYDLADHAAEFFGEGDQDKVARVKSDYRETLSAMHYDYVAYWVKWSHEHGYKARNQAHGAPGNLLDLYAVADVPETEVFGSTPLTLPGFRRDPSEIASNREANKPLAGRFSSSAAHVAGLKLTSSETLTWLREHFKVALSEAKPEVDQVFLDGINHILFHGTCYSPDDAAWPGWEFYASTEMNPRDTLWKTLPQMNAYIQRCQSILQSGSPDNDILLYWPIYDNWNDAKDTEKRFTIHNVSEWLEPMPLGAMMKQLTDGGYAYDLVSDAQLKQLQNAGTGLKAPGGTYKVILLPKTDKMPVETLKRLLDLANGGATVIFTSQLPQDVPGLSNLDARRAEFKQQLSRLTFDGQSLAGMPAGTRLARVGSGRVLVGDGSDAFLHAAGVRREGFASADIGFIRRSFDGGNHYFIASLGTSSIDGWVPLAVPMQSAVVMNPLNGKTGVAAVRQNEHGPQIYLQLKPGESIIVRTFKDRKAQGATWPYTSGAGEPVTLSGTWNVDFIDGAPALPASYQTSRLGSWADRPDPEAQRFAGTARYRLTFDRPASVTGPSLLDLGDVREAAKVRLNGTEIGSAWSIPFQLNLPAMKDRGNVLEIEVTNLPANRVRDLDARGVQWRIFKEINYVNINYQPFDASKWPLAPSGLLGPVRLVPLKPLSP